MLRAAAVWFAQVFALGFGLGAVRQLLLVERLGPRAAELVEIPVMCVCIAWLARRRERRTRPFGPARQLAIGFLALAFLLVAECALGFAMEGRTPRATLFDRDPVAGPAYAVGLLWFALAPWWWSRRTREVASASAT